MGRRFEPCRGHLNNRKKPWFIRLFCLSFCFLYQILYQIIYIHQIRESHPKTRYLSNISFSSKKPPRGWFFFINRQTLRLWVGTWGKCVPRFLPYPYDPHLLRLPRLVKEQNRNIGYKTRDHVLTQPVYINPVQSYQSHMSYLNTEENISGSW